MWGFFGWLVFWGYFLVFGFFCVFRFYLFVVYLLYGRKYRTPSVSDTVWDNCCEYLLWAPPPSELAHVQH